MYIVGMATRPLPDHSVLLELLVHIREKANLRQIEVAAALKRPQSFVSKYETGERRLDVLELREVCRACGIDLKEFVALLDRRTKR
jgi:transcriptional regulator with XRE-family HTH domain